MTTKDIQILCAATVEELFNLPVFKNSKLLAGEKGLQRPVSGFNLSDTPEYYNWLVEREILITTCYSIHKDPEAIENLIPIAAAKGIAGLFIKSKTYLGEIPQYMIRQANQYDLPLIELPPEVRFSAITKAISDELICRQTALLKTSISFNRMLTKTIVEGSDLAEIAHMISDMINASLLIVDTVNKRRAVCIASGDADVFADMDMEKIIDTITTNAKVHELTAGNGSFGYLYIYGTDLTAQLDPEMLSQILHNISLEISREQKFVDARDADFSSYIFHLLSDQITNEDWEISRAKKLGLDVSQMQLIMRVNIKANAQISDSSILFHQTLLLNDIQSLFQNLGFQVRMIHSADESIIILSTAQDSKGLGLLSQRFDFLAEIIEKRYSAINVTAGCSRPHSGIFGIIQCNQEACIAQKAAANSNSSFLSFDKLGVLRLIYADSPEKEINNFISETLGCLIKTDQPRNEELLNTLKCYLENHGNISKVSEKLFTHYNTVSYRLKNIAEITKHDLRNPDERFELELALRLFESSKPN